MADHMPMLKIKVVLAHNSSQRQLHKRVWVAARMPTLKFKLYWRTTAASNSSQFHQLLWVATRLPTLYFSV
jgi:hypothetical protein